MKKYKKPLFIALLALDFVITVFLFVISIFMLVKMAQHPNQPQDAAAASPELIKFFINNPTVYLVACVIPLFLLLAVNIVGLVIYVRKTAKKEPTKLDELSEEQKEALRQELLKDLQGGSGSSKEEKKEEPAEEPKEEQEDKKEE